MTALPQQNVRAALLLAIAGFATHSLGDALVKTMAGQWPGTAVAMLRYSAAAVALAVLGALREGRVAFRMPKPWLQFGRGAGVALATICFFLGVMAMPLADATATIGHLLIYLAVVRASAALVAPMTYVQLLIAAALGWLVFGNVPDLSTFAGAALIIGGGLLLWRAQTPQAAAAPE